MPERLALGPNGVGARVANELAGVRAAVEAHLGGLRPGRDARRHLGVPQAAKPVTIAALAAAHAGVTLVVAPSAGRALALEEELTLYAGELPIARLSEQERLPYELAEDDSAVVAERDRALRHLRAGEPAIVVGSWASLSEFRAGPEQVGAGTDIQAGQTLAPADLQRRLEAAGYVLESLADQPGTATRRGGLLDVFPAGAEGPLRIEFFGDEIESIRRIDLGTQRSAGRVEAVHLAPLASHTVEAAQQARDLLETISVGGDGAEAVAEELELLSGGERSRFAGFFEPLLNRATALDHLGRGSLIVLEEEEEGEAALGQLLEHQEEVRTTLEGRGAIPTGLPPLNLEAATVRRVLADQESRAELHRFGASELGAERLPFTAAPAFGGRIREVVTQAAAWAEEGRSVVIASQQALRLGELMEEEGLAPLLRTELAAAPAAASITLVHAAASGGFLLGEELALISDEEVFGLRRRRRPQRKRAGVRPSLLTTLHVGDHVVHLDHGIARFGGLTRRSVDGVEREYLELQYAEGDRLYAPTDQLEAVSAYVGPSDRPPALTRLGSQEWARAKRRVRRAVAEIAQDLLELYARRAVAEGTAFEPDGPWQLEMEGAFAFVETADQLQAIAEVKADMESSRPMDRLIAGDVGYGKTEVAVRAAFKAVMAGRQVALLVPTTVLAEQHGETFRERTAGFPVNVAVLSRFRSAKEQQEIVAGIADGSVDVAIGTHRVLQRDVAFKDLGLVVIDEEQRFGVVHKERFKQMRAEVDILTMSATPIPRTLQMSLAGIRDMSTVMTPPEERLPVRTYVTGWDDEIVREAIMREMERGGQIYFVHNRVQNIERVAARLRDLVPEASIAIGHGQMPEEQLERVMLEFGAGESDVLLCTTIIESGLDIPNVNTIIINNANQFGLAQLYQLRGRVGRSANRAFAYLLYDRDRAISETAQKRLEAIFEASELGAGFQIALRDLEIRGAGNLLGSEQSGHIAAVGFDMFSRLVAEAVESLGGGLEGSDTDAEPKLPPPPRVDLPASASIPERYVEDMDTRLSLYERIAEIDSAEAVAAMKAELSDRFGPPPPLVENLLFIALVKTAGQRAGIERISTSPESFHLRVRGGTQERHRRAVAAFELPGIRVGPEQVRIPREEAGTDWMSLLIQILRTLGETREPAMVAGGR